MAQRNIDFGTFPDDPDADAIRTAFQKVQQNFTEVYAGVEGAAVSSINRTPGAGITVSSPTGNVIITANIACVQFSTFTLSIARDTPTQNPSAQNATITSSPQTLQINLPANIANIESANFVSSLTTVSNPGVKVNQTWNNSSVGFTGIYENITDTASASTSKLLDLQVGGTSKFTVFKNGNLIATGNATFNDLTANNFSINTVSVTGNISAGNISTTGVLNVTGNANVGNIGAADGVYTSNVTAGNVYANTGTIGASLLTGTLTTNAQPNVTSVGTLTSLAVTGNTTSGNVYANSGTIGASLLTGTLTTNAQPNVTSLGTLTSLAVSGNITAANIQGPLANGNSNVSIPSANGNVNISAVGNANIVVVTGTGANVTGTFNVTGNANVGNIGSTNGVYTGNVTSGNVYANAGTIGASLLTGTLTTNAQPNITSVGTLTTLQVTGNIEAGNVYSNSGTLGASLLTGTLTTNSQPNITGVGTLTTLTVSGNASAGNLNAGNLLTANFVTGTLTTNAQPNITSVGTLTSLAVTGNTTSGNVYANTGTIGASLLTGTLTTNAQPNVTSVGTLTSLSVTGNASAGNLNAGNLLTANFVTGTLTTNTQPNITSVGNLTNLVSNGTINFANASNVNIGDLANLHISGGFPGYTIKTDGAGNLTWAIDTTAAGGSNTEVQFNDGGTLGGSANYTFNKTTNLLSVNGNIQASNANLGNAATANYFIGNLYGQANTAAHVTDASQPNITSVGSLVGLTVSNSAGSVNFSNTADINLGVIANLHISGGLPSTVLTTDGAGNLSFTSFAGSPPGGANTQVQFNDSTTYGGSAGLTFNKTSNVLTVGANVISGNVYANSGTIGASLLTGTLTTNAQPNITSVGTLTGLLVNGNINAGNMSVTGIYTGNGSGLSQLAGGNVTGTVANATYAVSAGSTTTAGTVTTAAQPNITSVGTLTSLAVTGNITGGNVYANSGTIGASLLTGTLTTNAQPNITSLGSLTSLIVNGNINAGNIAGGNLVSANFFSGNGNALFNIQGANVTGTVANATYATSAGSATSATTAGTVTSNTQSNITSVGTLTGLNVNGNITAANITANTGIFTGNGAGLTNLNASNISSGTLAQARLANASLTVNGTSISLGGSGTITANTTQTLTRGTYLTGSNFDGGTATTWAVDATDAATASKVVARDANASFAGNVITATTFAGSGANITTLNASNISSGTLAQARLANSSLTVNGTAISLGGSGTITANTTQTLTLGSFLTGTSFNGGTAVTAAVDATSANTASKVVARDASGNFSAGTITATLSGAATTAGTVTTAAQPNITSTGTLTSLSVTGNISAGNVSATTFTGALSGAATTAGTVTTNAQPNITSVGTLNSANIINNSTGYSIQLPGIVGSATTDSRITTLSSRGTLSVPTQIQSGDVLFTVAPQPYTGSAFTGAGRIQFTATDNITAANRGSRIEFIGIAAGGSTGTTMSWDGSTLQVDGAVGANSTITGTRLISNIASGTAPLTVTSTTRVANLNVATSGVANTVNDAAQPNITSVGTLTSLSSSGNISAANVSVSGFHIRSVTTGIAAAGTAQGNATALTTEINMISTVSSGQGVRLPTAVAGMVIMITNLSANSLLVYPHTGGDINGGAANVAYTQAAGATLQFMAPNTTDWYTVGATYA